jgi:hypothetical protein
MKNLLLFLVFSLLGFKSFSQQETLAKFIVLEFKNNGQDYTNWSLDRSQYIVFFVNEDKKLCMANVCGTCKNEQSYGNLYHLDNKSYGETNTTYKMDIFKYRWQYFNTYDNKTGSAIIELTKVYKPQGVAFEMKMIIENLDILTYKGYMEGSINFSDYD